MAAAQGEDRKHEAREKEGAGQDGRGAGEHVGRTAAREEPASATHTERAALGFLQKHDADQGEHDQKMDDDDNGLHGFLAGTAVLTRSRPRLPPDLGAITAWRKPAPNPHSATIP